MGKIRTHECRCPPNELAQRTTGSRLFKRKNRKGQAASTDVGQLKEDKPIISTNRGMCMGAGEAASSARRKKVVVPAQLTTSLQHPNKNSISVGRNTKKVMEGKPDVLSSTPSVNWQRFLNMTVEKSAKLKSDIKGIGSHEKSLQSKPKTVAHNQYQEVKKPGISSSKAGKTSGCRLTRVLAIDCEMVGVADVKKSMLARVSIVNQGGECVYDKFVQPTEPVTDYRTWVSGIRPVDLEKGEPFEVVKNEVREIINNHIIVGHAVQNDFKALHLSHPKHLIRDTSSFPPFREMFDNKSPALRALAKSVLGVHIQTGEHSSVQDARATLQLYVMYKQEFEDWQRKRKNWQRKESA